MQTTHKNVVVFVTQRELQARASKPDGSSASTTALQYVAENTGFDVVTFRVDFSESNSIKLHRPVAKGDTLTNNLQKATQELAFDCELHPFERKVLAYVIKRGKNRAFVRVQYAVTAVVTPSVDVIVDAQAKAAQKVLQQLQRSNHTFSHISKWKALPCRPEAEINRGCAEINQYFRDFGELFVDQSFPPEAKSLYDSEAPNKLSDGDSAVYSLCTWEHLHSIIDPSWTFVAPTKVRSNWSTREPASFTSGLPAQDSFLCALSIIAPHCEMWLQRWFPDLDAMNQIENMVVIPVALYDRGLTWQRFLVDLFFPSFPLGRGLMTPRNIHGELFAALLHKAYAKLKGSYATVSCIPTMTILRELTGFPWVCCYRRSAEKHDGDSPIQQVHLQEAVQTTLFHQRPGPDKASSLVVVTCGKIDAHHRGFRLEVSSDEGSGTTCAVLHDTSGKYLREQIAATLNEFNREQDPSALHLSWEQLLKLEPVVWSLSLRRQYEQRLRQIFLHEGDTIKLTAAISVPALSTIVFSSSYSNHFTRETCDQQLQIDLDVSIAFVETDFSLTRIEGNNTDNLTSTWMSFQNLADNHDGVFSKRVVRTLSAGEYVVTISARCPGCSELHPDPSKAEEAEPASDKAVLNSTSVDANLQLIFDCLDKEGRHELSKSDINSFLQLYERLTLSQRGNEALRSFLHQHGSSPCPRVEERRLTLDDLREIYLSQAIRDCNEGNSNSATSRALCSDNIRTRFQDLVWQELRRLLSGPAGCVETDLAAEINLRTEIDCRDVVSMVCCFYSDTPLLNVVTLPEDQSSLDSNNFNI